MSLPEVTVNNRTGHDTSIPALLKRTLLRVYVVVMSINGLVHWSVGQDCFKSIIIIKTSQLVETCPPHYLSAFSASCQRVASNFSAKKIRVRPNQSTFSMTSSLNLLCSRSLTSKLLDSYQQRGHGHS